MGMGLVLDSPGAAECMRMLEGRRRGDSAVVRRLLRSELCDDEDWGREAAERGTGSESRRGRWCVDIGGLSIIPSSGAVSGCRSPGRSWCRVWSGPDWRRKSNHVSLPYASGGWIWLPEKARAGVPAASPSRRLGGTEGSAGGTWRAAGGRGNEAEASARNWESTSSRSLTATCRHGAGREARVRARQGWGK
jgi:hypothetical protein